MLCLIGSSYGLTASLANLISSASTSTGSVPTNKHSESFIGKRCIIVPYPWRRGSLGSAHVFEKTPRSRGPDVLSARARFVEVGMGGKELTVNC